MEANVGMWDRVLRFVVGLALILIPVLGIWGIGASAFTYYVMIAVGAILALTAIFGICPAYNLFGIRTNS